MCAVERAPVCARALSSGHLALLFAGHCSHNKDVSCRVVYLGILAKNKADASIRQRERERESKRERERMKERERPRHVCRDLLWQ